MGVGIEDYPLFKELNRNVIKPAIKEVNALTNFFIEVDQKRIGRRIGELKFTISRLKELPSLEPAQMPLFADIGDLSTIAIKLIQAGVSRKEALRIANQEWDVVDAAALPEDKTDFAVYVEDKIGLARHATSVKMREGSSSKRSRKTIRILNSKSNFWRRKSKRKKRCLRH